MHYIVLRSIRLASAKNLYQLLSRNVLLLLYRHFYARKTRRLD